MEAMVEEAERAERMAIISECIDRGALAWYPPPVPSKGMNGFARSDALGFPLSFCFFNFSFSSLTAVPSKAPLAIRPFLRAPPLKPGR